MAPLKHRTDRHRPRLLRPRSGDAGQRGSALLFVLIMGALMTSLTLVAMRGFSAAARATAVYQDEVRAEELGRSGIDLALGYLSLMPPRQRVSGTTAFTADRGTLKVDFMTEAGRLDLNLAPPEAIAAVIQGAGVGRDLALRLGDQIADWREPGTEKRLHGAKDDDYAARNLPPPAKRPFVSVYELSRVLDVTPDVMQLLQPLVTVASGSEKINPLYADAAMIRALLGGDADLANAYVQRRSRGFDKPTDALDPFSSTIKGFLSAEAGGEDGIRLFVEARAGRIGRRYEGVVRMPGGERPEPSVLSWKPLGG